MNKYFTCIGIPKGRELKIYIPRMVLATGIEQAEEIMRKYYLKEYQKELMSVWVYECLTADILTK